MKEEFDTKEIVEVSIDTKESLKEPFESENDLGPNNSINDYLKSKQKPYIKRIILIIFLIIIVLVFTGIIIIIIIITDLKENKIEIICQYKKRDNQEINLLSKYYKELSNNLIYINGSKVSNRNYTFESKEEILNVIFIQYETLKLENMFKDVKELYSVEINATNKVSFDDSLENAFTNCENLRYFTSNITRGNIIDMSYMFSNCTNLKNVTFEYIGNSTKNFSHMFENCINLTSLNLKNFSTNNAEDMSYMFFNCKSLNLTNFYFDTSNVTNMSNMFSGCGSLTSLDLTNFNTNFVIDMSYMFANCYSIKDLDINSFNISGVEDMSFMFVNCSKLEKLVYNNSSFIPNRNANFNGMFDECNNTIIPDWYNPNYKLIN